MALCPFRPEKDFDNSDNRLLFAVSEETEFWAQPATAAAMISIQVHNS